MDIGVLARASSNARLNGGDLQKPVNSDITVTVGKIILCLATISIMHSIPLEWIVEILSGM